jgi:hypothetical protein
MLPGLAGVAGLARFGKLFSYQEFSGNTSNLTSYTFSNADLGAAEAGRVIIATITANGGSAKTISSVTIGGVSASILVQASNGDWTGGIAAAVVPTGATGNIVAALSSTAAAASVGVYRAIGLASAAALDTDSNTDYSQLTLTSDPSGFVIALCTNAGTGTTITWTGATEDFDTTVEDNSNRISGASGSTLGTTVAVQPTAAGTPTSQVFVAATF